MKMRIINNINTQQESWIHRDIVKIDNKKTPLQLADPGYQQLEQAKSMQEMIVVWKGRRYLNSNT